MKQETMINNGMTEENKYRLAGIATALCHCSIISMRIAYATAEDMLQNDVITVSELYHVIQITYLKLLRGKHISLANDWKDFLDELQPSENEIIIAEESYSW